MFNSQKKLWSLLVGIDTLVIIMLMAQFGVPSLNIGGIFDYYLFYAIIIVIVNIVLIIRIMIINQVEKFEQFKSDYLDSLKENVGNFDFANKELFKIERFLKIFKPTEKSFGKLSDNMVNILSLNDEQIKNKLLKLSDNAEENTRLNSIFHEITIQYRDNVNVNCSIYASTDFRYDEMVARYTIVGIGFSAIILMLVGMGFNNKTISEQSLVRTYVSKYDEIAQKINVEKEKIEQKNVVIGKLNELKNSYIATYGTGSEIVSSIENDINNLQN